jgi:sugar transferase (PEP-CTERM system associated)
MDWKEEGKMTGLLLALILGDCVCALAGISTALFFRFEGMPRVLDLAMAEPLNRGGFVVAVLFSSFFVELYRINAGTGWKDIALRITYGVVLSFVLLSSLYYLMPSVMLGRGILVLALVFFVLLQFVWHVFFRIRANLPVFAKRVLILGAGPLAERIGSIISSPNSEYVLAGYVSRAGETVNVPGHAIVGSFEDIFETVKRKKADKVVVSLSERRGVFPLQEMLNCKLSGVKVVDAPSFYEQVTGKLLLENITPSWFIFSHGFRITLLKRIAKRSIDVSLSLAGLLLFLPFFPLIALLIRLDSPGPVFFGQERVGENERNFTVCKFRTMRQDAERLTGAVWAQKDDPRVTRLGRLLRRCRIDEIPQLVNVLLGEMSLVGPRPERPEFVAKLKEVVPYYSERHFVKPGVTGWAQVCYPYGASVEDALEKLRYDLYYTKNISLALDVRIIFKTVKVVLSGQGGR